MTKLKKTVDAKITQKAGRCVISAAKASAARPTPRNQRSGKREFLIGDGLWLRNLGQCVVTGRNDNRIRVRLFNETDLEFDTAEVLALVVRHERTYSTARPSIGECPPSPWVFSGGMSRK